MKKQSRVKRVALFVSVWIVSQNIVDIWRNTLETLINVCDHVLSVLLLSLASVRAGELVIIHHLWCVTRFDTETLEGAPLLSTLTLWPYWTSDWSHLHPRVWHSFNACLTPNDTFISNLYLCEMFQYHQFRHTNVWNFSLSECVSLRLIIVEFCYNNIKMLVTFLIQAHTWNLFIFCYTSIFCLFEFKTPSSRNGEYKLNCESDKCLWHCVM